MTATTIDSEAAQAEILQERLGRSYIIHEVVESTMPMMDEMIQNSCADGTTVVALRQTKGRGSGNRSWASPSGNVLFSRCVAVEAGNCGQEMEMIAALAVAEIVRELLPDHDIVLKYPNDVLVEGKKISGCLVPPVYDIDPESPRKVNLGVGVNLRVAPQLVDGRQTACLADYGVDCELGDFIMKFDVKFRELCALQASCGFTCMLDRMGFLGDDGKLALRLSETQEICSGIYAGFKVHGSGKTAAAFLIMTDEVGALREYEVHTVTMAAALRPTGTRLPREHLLHASRS